MRSQYISYDLSRSSYITPIERSMLQYIASYSNVMCGITVKQIGEHIGRSESAVKRVLRSLSAKGLIDRKYSWYKKLVVKLASIEEQNRIAGLKAVKRAVQVVENISKKYYRSFSNSDRSKMNYPNKNETKEIKRTGFYKVFEEEKIEHEERSPETAALVSSFLANLNLK